MKLFSSKEGCSGCTACMNVCPKHAISMRPDEKGFLYPHIDPALCMNCGLCRQVCPMQQKLSSEKAVAASKPDFYAAKHKSDEVRMQSSSGGMFTAISDRILEKNGTVYGAAFDEDFQVCHKRAETKEERNRFRGSKYVQSDLGSTFTQVKADLASGMPVLFSGTPCQTAGLNRFLTCAKVDTGRLYLCDLVCHGTPSPKLWSDYLLNLSKRYHSRIASYSFRNKKAGWRGYHILIQFENQKEIQEGAVVKSYINLFGSTINFRPSCYQCPFANLNRPSDLTIGDFWGIEKSMPDFEDKKGVSLVLVNTEKGSRMFHAVEAQLEVRPVLPEQGMQVQWNLKQPSLPSPKTAAFWSDYQNHGFEFIAKKYASAGVRGKIKSGIKHLLKHLGLLGSVKKLLHRKN